MCHKCQSGQKEQNNLKGFKKWKHSSKNQLWETIIVNEFILWLFFVWQSQRKSKSICLFVHWFIWKDSNSVTTDSQLLRNTLGLLFYFYNYFVFLFWNCCVAKKIKGNKKQWFVYVFNAKFQSLFVSIFLSFLFIPNKMQKEKF